MDPLGEISQRESWNRPKNTQRLEHRRRFSKASGPMGLLFSTPAVHHPDKKTPAPLLETVGQGPGGALGTLHRHHLLVGEDRKTGQPADRELDPISRCPRSRVTSKLGRVRRLSAIRIGTRAAEFRLVGKRCITAIKQCGRPLPRLTDTSLRMGSACVGPRGLRGCRR